MEKRTNKKVISCTIICFILLFASLLALAVFGNATEVMTAKAANYTTQTSDIKFVDGKYCYQNGDYYYKFDAKIAKSQSYNVINSSSKTYAWGQNSIQIYWERNSINTRAQSNADGWDMATEMLFQLYKVSGSTETKVGTDFRAKMWWSRSTARQYYINGENKSIDDFSLHYWTWSGLTDNTKYVIKVSTEGYRNKNNTPERSGPTICATFYVKDTAAPTINLTNVNNNGYSNQNVTMTFSDSFTGVKTSSHSTGTVFSTEGGYTITATDYAGNVATRSFTIDKTAPTGTLSGVSNNGYTKTPFSFSWSDASASATLDGSAYTKSTNISSEGLHTLVLTDLAGNSTTYKGTYDATAPTVTVTPSVAFQNTNFTKGNVKVTYSDTYGVASATSKKGTAGAVALTSGTTFTADGEYTITVTDRAGNVTTKTFVIDATAPTFTATPSVAFQNTNFTSGNVKLTYVETNLVSATYKIGSSATQSFSNNATVTAEGAYGITITDKAGNSCTASFVIDHTAPAITLSGVTNGGYTNINVSASYSDTNFLSATLDGNTYTSGTEISAEGAHTVIVTDKAGNSVTRSFTIDKTAPAISLSGGLATGAYTASNVTVSFVETNLQSATWKKGTDAASSFSGEKTFSTEGMYTITVTDLAENSSTATFTIDKTPPTVTVTPSVAFQNTNYTKGNVTVSYSDTYGVATSKYKTNIVAETTFTSNTPFSTEGTYTITVTDLAGNSCTASFVIDTTPPEITLSGVTNGGYTNINVSATYNDANFLSATLDGAAYASGTSITTEGTHTVIVTDKAGNSVTRSFTIDKTAPAITLTGATNGGYTKTNVTVAFTEINLASATLDGEAFTSGETVSTEGVHTVDITDLAGNNSTATFTIDKTAPAISLSGGLATGAYTASNVTVSFVETNLQSATFTKDGTNQGAFYSGASITDEGAYTFTVTDKVNQSATVSFTIDKTAPAITLSGATNGGYTHTAATVSFVEANLQSATYTKNGADQGTFSSGDPFEADGVYVFTVTDKVNQSSTVSFTIDKTKPTVTVTPSVAFQNTNFTKGNVTVTYSDTNLASATLDGKAYTSGTEISAEGTHDLVLTDRAGNSSTVSFVIDHTAPAITLSGVTNGGYTKSNVTVAYSDVNLQSATHSLNEGSATAFNSGAEFSAEGAHVVTVIDRAGNTNRYSFVIDKTAPGLTIRTNTGNTIEGITNEGISVRATNLFAEGATAYKPECTLYYKTPAQSAFTVHSGLELEIARTAANGSYSFYAEDGLGNRTPTRAIIIDSAAPTISVYKGAELLAFDAAGDVYLNGSFSAVAADETTAYYNGSTITIRYQLPNVHVIDDITSFYGDLFAPIYFNGNNISGGTQADPTTLIFSDAQRVTFSWADQYDGHALQSITFYNSESIQTDSFTVADGVTSKTLASIEDGRTLYFIKATYDVTDIYYTVYIDTRSFYASNETNFTIDNPDVGAYLLYAEDLAGNRSKIYRIIFDTTAPTGTLSGVSTGGVTNTNVIFTWSEEGATATLNGAMYSSGASISATGDYTIVLTDRAGNSTSYSFAIDKIPPTGTLSGVTNGGYTNAVASFSWTEADATATLDGITYTSGAEITTEGAHVIVLTDAVGNSNSYSFTTDTTPYSANRDYFFSQGISSITHWYETYDYSLNTNSHTQEIGQKYSFSNYADCLNYSLLRERALAYLETGYYTGNSIDCVWASKQNLQYYPQGQVLTAGTQYWIYYSIESKNTLYAYIDTDALNEAIESYAVKGCSEYYVTDYNNSPALEFPGMEGISEQITHRNIVFFKTAQEFRYKNPAGISLTINGVAASYDYQLTPGSSYIITETDLAGNVCSYSIYVDADTPVISCFDLTGEPIPAYNSTFQSFSSVYTSQVWSITANDFFDTLSVMKIVGNASTIYLFGGERYTFTESGKYTVTISDVLRNKTTYTVYVSLTAPEATTAEHTTPTGTLLGFYLNIDPVLSYNSVSTILIRRDGDQIYQDDNALQIAAATSQYYFATSGIYTVLLQDNFGRTVEFTYEFEKDTPRGNITTLPGLALPNGVHTTLAVKFVWTDETCSATLNGEDYTSGVTISAEGSYEIVLKNLDNKESHYFFYIDRTAPTGTLENVTNGGVTKRSVTFTWAAAENATVSISKDGGDFNPQETTGESITINALISHQNDGLYTLRLTDAAGNYRDYSFTIDTVAPTISVLPATSSSSPVPVYYNNVIIRYEINQNFYLTWTEMGSTCVYTFNASPDTISYSKNSILKDEGTYAFTLTDRAGNKDAVTIKIDRSAPAGTLSGVENEGITNGDVTFTWSEDGATATLDGEAYESGAVISAEGAHAIVLKNYLGTPTTYTFTIDKTAPVGSFSLPGVVAAGTTFFKQNVYFSWSERSATATLDGEAYSSSTISAEGAHVIVLTDLAGNSTTYTCIVDKTAPVGTLFGVTNNGYTNTNVSFSWEEDGATAKIDGAYYPAASAISAAGYHTIVLTDRAGNSAYYNFTIDRTAPVGTFSVNGNLVGDVRYFKQNISLSWNKSGVTATLSDHASAPTSYSSGNIISKEGTYTVDLIDRAGNTASYDFVIDKTAPVIVTLINGEVVPTGNYYAAAVAFRADEPATFALNSDPYTAYQTIELEGEYSISATDLAGNKTTQTFVIDTTAPAISFSQSYQKYDNIFYFAQRFSVSWTELCNATLDGNNYSKNAQIYYEGIYSFVLTDRAGNTTEATLVLLLAAPELHFSAIHKTVNGTFYFTEPFEVYWESAYSAECELTVNDELKTNHFFVTDEGAYTVTITDRAGNSAIYALVLDTTAPVGTLSGVPNGGITNGDVTFSWNEEGAGATLDGAAYSSGVTISSEGAHTIILTDRAGNSNVFSFTIDKRAPEGVLTGVTDGGVTNGEVTFDWDEEGATATINDSSYVSGTLVTTEGEYVIILTNYLGTSTVYTFTIDKTSPLGTFEGLNEHAYSNGVVKFYYTSENTCTLDGYRYTSGAEIRSVGAHTIVLVDNATNSVTYNFVIDKTAPVGTLTGTTNGGITNGAVTFAWEEERATATLNGEAYTSGKEILAEGVHTIVLQDLAGNTSSVSFEIDLTAPIGTLDGVTNGGFTNTNVRFTWGDNSSCRLDGTAYNSGKEISAAGHHVLVLTDRAGNCSTYSFTIDRTAPTGELSGVTNGGITNGDVTFSWNEEGAGATLDGEAYKNSSAISAEGVHVIVLTDLAGNTTQYNFEIDLTAPTGTLSGVSDGGVTKGDVSFTWTEAGATATLDEAAYTKGAAITAEGIHILVLKDTAGNSESYIFTIDKTCPFGVLEGVVNNGYTNTAVTFSWNEDGATATLDGAAYQSGAVISEEGSHTIVIADAVGNSFTYYFIIILTPPEGELEGVTNGGATNTRVSFTWEAIDATATLNDAAYISGAAITAEGFYVIVLTDRAGNATVYLFEIDLTAPTGILQGVENNGYTNREVTFSWTEEGATATLDGEAYESGAVVSEEGAHVFSLSDALGNTRSYSFTIDVTDPDGVLSGVENGGITNSSVTFSWTEEGITATLDGSAYTSGALIAGEGAHLIEIEDRAGNTVSYSFEIDKTAPEGELEGVENGGVTNIGVIFYFDDENFTATLNGEEFDFDEEITAEGAYVIVLTDKAGNNTTYNFEIDLTAPTGTLSGVEDGGYVNGIVTFSWTEAGASATLNGERYSKNTPILKELTHVIVLTDAVGNSREYSFTIDKTAPTGELEGVTSGGVTNGDVTFSWTEEGATATLDGEPYESGAKISEEGSHTIVLRDLAGNATSFPFIIDRSSPIGTLIGVENAGVTNTKTVTFTWSDISCSATVDGVSYSKGTTITAEGLHVIVLTDKAGNSSTYRFEIDLTAPEGELVGVIDGGYTNSAVTFAWTEEGATATLDGEAYESGTEISDEGAHVIVLMDLAGNATTITFEIDVTAPEGTLTGVTNGAITNKNVVFTWNEYKAFAKLDGEAYSSGTRISAEGAHDLVLTDRAGNSNRYTFTIDTTAPTGTLEGVANGGYTREKVTFTWSEDGATATLNGKTFENGAEITAEGAYTLVLSDKIGNNTTYNFTIDFTAPEATFSVKGNLTDDIYYFNKSFTLLVNESNITSTYAKDDGDVTTFEKQLFISKEGSYVVELEDRAGNKTTYNIKLILPSAKLPLVIYSEGEEEVLPVVNNSSYTCDAPVMLAIPTGYTAYVNGSVYASEQIDMTEEGTYNIVFTDAAGNETKMKIVRKNPVIEEAARFSTVDIVLMVIGSAVLLIIVGIFLKSVFGRRVKFNRQK